SRVPAREPSRHRGCNGGGHLAADLSRADPGAAGGGRRRRRGLLPVIFVTTPLPADRPVRFALVGCGRIADRHIEAIERHSDRAELVAVCDADPGALERAVARTGAPGFGSLDALLAGSSPDCVVLA